MALNIKNADVETLLDEVVRITGETKTEAVRRALQERYQRLSMRQNQQKDKAYYLAFLQDEIWQQVPTHLLGITISREEEEAILGYSELGV